MIVCDQCKTKGGMTAIELIAEIREIFGKQRYEEDAVHELWKYLEEIEEAEGEQE